jgi:short-subunit dehydrogenase
MEYFQNKVIWITGASSGIGLALAKELAKIDCKLILSSRSKMNAEEFGKSSSWIAIDLASPESIETCFDKIKRDYGRVDILFSNGGMSQRGHAVETKMEVDRQIMEVNYFGNIHLAKLCLPLMKENGFGHFVITSSIAGKFGFFERSSYSASKHALHGYYESLALEEEADNIHVTMVCPGRIRTNISKNALSGDGSTHGTMDYAQESGMSAKECAKQMLKATSKRKPEVLIGGKEIKAVTLKRFLPKVFRKVIRKQKPNG